MSALGGAAKKNDFVMQITSDVGCRYRHNATFVESKEFFGGHRRAVTWNTSLVVGEERHAHRSHGLVTTCLPKVASRLYVQGYQGHLIAGQGSEPWAKPGADGHEIQDHWLPACWPNASLDAQIVGKFLVGFRKAPGTRLHALYPSATPFGVQFHQGMTIIGNSTLRPLLRGPQRALGTAPRWATITL